MLSIFEGEENALCVHHVFLHLSLFHSFNRPFQSHAIVILALQSRRGCCARPPLNIRCTDTVSGEPVTCETCALPLALARASKHTVSYMTWLVIDFRAIPTFPPVYNAAKCSVKQW